MVIDKGYWLVDSGSTGRGPRLHATRDPHNFFRQQKNQYICTHTGVFWAVYEPKMYICVRGSAPTQPGSSYYYYRAAGQEPRICLLTGVLISSVLTQNFGRMSFGGLPQPGALPGALRNARRTCVPCLLVNFNQALIIGL